MFHQVFCKLYAALVDCRPPVGHGTVDWSICDGFRWRHRVAGCKQASLTLFPPEQNGHHFADDIFRCVFVNKRCWVLITISLKFVPKRPIGLDNGLVPNRRQATI